MNATAAVVDGKMEPVGKQEPAQQSVITGQALYNEFLAGESNVTRMNFIRTTLAADPVHVKGACDNMVELARKADIANGVPEDQRGPKRNTAMNVRTLFQQIWGALKFAEPEMKSLGFGDKTGWLEARAMAKVALNKAGKTWQGFDVPTQEQKEQKKLARDRKEVTEAMLEATKQTPQAINESFESWQKRIADKARGLVEQAKQEKLESDAQAAFDYLAKKYDVQVLIRVQDMLSEHIEQLAIEAAKQSGHIEDAPETDDAKPEGQAHVDEEAHNGEVVHH